MNHKQSSDSDSEDSAVKNNGTALKKKGKFSNRESELIVKTVKDFIASNGLTVGDLCSKLRDSGTCVARHQVWNELANLLPHRDRKCIQHHAHRQLVKEVNKDVVWTEEDKSLLQKLAVANNFSWATVGRLMGRHNEDCRHTYGRMEARVNHGRFTPEEDRKLTKAVRKVLKLPRDTPIQEMPTKGISWQAVADRMKNARRARDYLPHWNYIQMNSIRGHFTTDNRSNVIGESSVLPTPGRMKPNASRLLTRVNPIPAFALRTNEGWEFNLRWLECIRKCDPEDESDITWTEIDAELLLPPHHSQQKWKAMTKAMDREKDFPEKLEDLLRIYRVKRADALLIYAEPIPPIDPNLEDVIKSEKGTDISAVDSDDAAHVVPCDKGNPAGTESTDANLSSLDEEQEAKAERKRIRQERRERKRLAAQSVDSFDWLAPPPVHVAALNSKIKARKSTQDEDEEESKEELVIKEELCDIDVLPDEEEERLKEERRCHRQEKRERKRARREARGKSEEGG